MNEGDVLLLNSRGRGLRMRWLLSPVREPKSSDGMAKGGMSRKEALARDSAEKGSYEFERILCPVSHTNAGQRETGLWNEQPRTPLHRSGWVLNQPVQPSPHRAAASRDCRPAPGQRTAKWDAVDSYAAYHAGTHLAKMESCLKRRSETKVHGLSGLVPTVDRRQGSPQIPGRSQSKNQDRLAPPTDGQAHMMWLPRLCHCIAYANGRQQDLLEFWLQTKTGRQLVDVG
ncbi:hypothetical protein B0T17DRAFT_503125 [Bombardia bombarda]|uniref:Uncharacterized protein n=1 Tax=Bombardia bombarda TaxID=252184 RepID=A0AA39XKC3_9PEZI|nr:hypothetical protein B0T17DRAFT_503125 [Bombardia bombarda]